MMIICDVILSIIMISIHHTIPMKSFWEYFEKKYLLMLNLIKKYIFISNRMDKLWNINKYITCINKY